jgi:hypothetical protein
LIGFWSFDSKDMTETIAYDRSGQDNNGTLINRPRRVTGKVGQALQFDGVDDEVTVGDTPDLRLNGAHTIAFWAKDTGSTTAFPGIVRKGNPDIVGDGYTIFWASTDHQLYYWRDNKHLAAGQLSSTDLQHFAFTYDGRSTWVWYINGVQSATGMETFVPITNIANLRLGIGSEFGKVLLDDVRLYNRVLAVDEIKQLVKLGNPG